MASKPFPTLFIFLNIILLAKSANTCQPTPIEDIMVAAYHSKYVYGDFGDIKVGDRVLNATDYKVEAVIDKNFTWLASDIGRSNKAHRNKGANSGSSFWIDSLRVIISTKICSTNCTPTVAVSFMGTRTIWQLIHEIVEFFRTPVIIKDKRVGVMSYTWRALQELNITNLLQMVTSNRTSKAKYIITGHSLGGSLASLFTLMLKVNPKEEIWNTTDTRLITFGQPRIGDKSYSVLHDEIIPFHKKLRIINDHDIVPHVPFQKLGFHHESREIWMQVPSLIFFWDTRWRVCSMGDAKECSNTLYLDNPLNHRISNYIAKVKAMTRDAKRRSKFETDQCSGFVEQPKEFVGGNICRKETPEDHLEKVIMKYRLNE